MPGAPFLHAQPSYQTVVGQGVRDTPAPANGSHGMFLVWLVVIGVVLPSLLLGGFNLLGFQFVFRSR